MENSIKKLRIRFITDTLLFSQAEARRPPHKNHSLPPPCDSSPRRGKPDISLSPGHILVRLKKSHSSPPPDDGLFSGGGGGLPPQPPLFPLSRRSRQTSRWPQGLTYTREAGWNPPELQVRKDPCTAPASQNACPPAWPGGG